MLLFLARKHRSVAWFLMLLFYCDLLLFPVIAKAGSSPYSYGKRYQSTYRPLYVKDTYNAARTAVDNKETVAAGNELTAVKQPLPERKPVKRFTTGPTQPEMQSFSSVNSNNMVDLFSGDFSYNIPLMDVGGYPVSLGYNGGISMDQEASWCGLGWNINPGTITRNMRGLPDDFNGASDSVKKTMSMRENKTMGVNAGADLEIVGLPLSVGASFGIFHNNYKGWGLENSINASISAGIGSRGQLSGGLSITNNSQEGLTMAPSFSVAVSQKESEDKNWSGGSFTVSAPYNTRSGLKALQISASVRQSGFDEKKLKQGKHSKHSYGNGFSTAISFASPTYNPTITMPFTSSQFTFTAKLGWEWKVVHPNAFITGYISKQRIKPADTLLALPSYGYLYFQDGAKNRAALLDFNREKEIPYREKPAVPHIAIPSYTYDAFSISGEGTGGMFRAYRGDIGFVYDHSIRTKDESNRLSVDVGIADMVHGGVDINLTRAFTENGPWLNENPLQQVIDFKNSSGTFESVYFRNPGEKSINSKDFYNAIGGDDVVTVGLAQTGGSNTSDIRTTNYLTRFKNKRKVGTSPLNSNNVVKQERDKRTQVISFLTAKEADAAGLSKYIDNYTWNQFNANMCGDANFDNIEGVQHGLVGEYFKGKKYLSGKPWYTRIDPMIDFDWGKGTPPIPGYQGDDFSIRWTGCIYIPQTGTYTFYTPKDDGVRLRINDVAIVDEWAPPNRNNSIGAINLVGGKYYKIQLDFFERGGKAYIKLEWKRPGQTNREKVPTSVLYPPANDTYPINSYLTKEKRVNGFRKENHISEITVLNNDGRRYTYGIPVYNLKQREATFAVDGRSRGDVATGLVGYNHGTDNSTNNPHGKDRYYSNEEVPAYAHSFLLTGILSPDYSDLTGNGITDDDKGDAVKFNYSKICGIANPFPWRAPAVDSVTYNEGLKSDYRDDKGSYVYGEKELWYLHSIESKSMMATFVLENRDDLPSVSEQGYRTYNQAKRLKEINLYSKADFMKKGTAARPVKTVHFEYNYQQCPGVNGTGGKLTLKKVWFTYNKNEKGQQNPYSFSYTGKNPSYNNKSFDRWGNYKDAAQNQGSKPGNIITNADYPYSLQDSTQAAQNAAAWALDSIHLPSGGSIKVDYESDEYAYVQNKRAMQLFKLVGLGTGPAIPANPSQLLYTGSGDHLYVYVKIPKPVGNLQELYTAYLEGIKKLYFKLYVKMPADEYVPNGRRSEFVSCYADLDIGNSYGIVNSNTIWLKLGGISLKGDGGGSYSPLAKAALQFLRLNLTSKAFPGSEVGDNLDLENGIKMLAAQADNIKTAFSSFDRVGRNQGWATSIDTSRSFVRLTNPYFKKYGGGHRVKRITVYDNWDKMTKQRPAVYGQEYIYTTQKEINGVMTTISSGVASYEPGMGGEENPFHVPVEYVEKIAPLGPVTLGYSEEPLGESFFPSASVGYSCVRTRTINYKNKKSANGYDETRFYTAYDFPTYTDRSLIDDDTKKRYKPGLANFLRVNAKHYISLSQGFKIELNDMHGKMRSKASYAETDAKTPISYSENVYKVENKDAEFKRLANTVMVMKPDGTIDSAALIGKDVELMVDMREQLSITNGYNVNLNSEMFSIPFPPAFFLIPSFLNLAQREENKYRSVATTKIVQRYGILDSVIVIDKGSKISTKDILYDSETGDVLVSRTLNEFNDYVYNVTWPSHWAYDGMGLAYKNIGATLNGVTIRQGKIVSGAADAVINALFSSGDEVLVAGKPKTEDSAACSDKVSFFPFYDKIWAVDSSVLFGGIKAFYFIDRSGKPYNGYNISLKIIRSGRRNMFGAVGSVTCMVNPLQKNINTGQYELVVNTGSKIIAASAGEFKQFWKVDDIMAREKTETCIPNWRPTGNVRCVQQNGVNTGYQEGEEQDINPRTHLGLRWVLLGLNCTACGRASSWEITGNTRCATDENGNNTGYQEREERDTVSCSETSGTTRWVSTGLNCAACARPAKWTAITGTVQCETVNGINTGVQLQQEQDTASCSSTSGQTRWIAIGQNCTACARPAKWTATGNFRCVTDGSGSNTGYQEREETDTASCSSTAGQTRWVLIGQNCTACSRPAKWINTGSADCEKDANGINTGYLLQQQTDTASCSSTSGTTRIVRTQNCTACSRPAKWINTGSAACEKDANGINTGYLLQEQTDTAFCSPTYGSTRTERTQNCTTCAKPQNWQFTGAKQCEIIFNGKDVVYTGYELWEERNMEPCSPGYNSTRWEYKVYNPSACANCDASTCSGINKKCIGGTCETGILVCIGSQWDTSMGEYLNTYHYEFSDESWSESFWNYEPNPCSLP